MRKGKRYLEMEINIFQLKEVIDLVLDHIIKVRGVEFCELENEFYWNIPSPDVYEPKKPEELDIGSLSDDLEFVLKLLENNSQPVAYQLTHLAPLLRYLGEHLSEMLAKNGG